MVVVWLGHLGAVQGRGGGGEREEGLGLRRLLYRLFSEDMRDRLRDEEG